MFAYHEHMIISGRDTWNWQSKNPNGYATKKPRSTSMCLEAKSSLGLGDESTKAENKTR